MKKHFLPLAFQAALLATPAMLGAQCLTDNFSTNSWTENVSGYSPNVSSNVMNFVSSATSTGIECAAMNYSYRSLGFTLNSTDAWTAEVEFTPLNASNSSNTHTFTPAHTILSLASSTTNCWNTNTSGTISNVDDVEVYYNCALNSNSSTWSLYGRSKDGTTWNTASSGIVIDPVANPGTTYYLRLQRLSATQGMLSVFSDAGFTTHVAGSPVCFPISSGVTGLNTVQMGAIPQGGYVRYLEATLDNLSICNDYFYEPYSSATGWTQTGTGVTVPTPTCNFTTCADNSDRSEELGLNGLIAHSYQWRAETEFTPTYVSFMGPGHGILCLAEGTTGNIWDFSPVNNQDVIAAYYSSAQYSGSGGWNLYGVAKDGSTWSSPSTGINLPSLNTTYYIVLERLNATCGMISVFSDAAHLNPVTGSPQTFTIPSGVTGLNTLSHTSMMQGSSSRSLSGTVDNTYILNNYETGGTIGSDQSYCGTSFTPNPLTSIAEASHVGCSGSGTYQWEVQSPCGSAWTNISGATSATYSPGTISVTTCYRRKATINQGCSTVDMYSNTVTVTLNSPPTADAGPPTTIIACCGSPVTLGGSPTASGGTSPYTYSWTPSTHLSCSNCANPTTDMCTWSPSENISFTLTVTDANGCTATDKVAVMRDPNCRLHKPGEMYGEITIYPNPSEGVFTIALLPGTTAESIEVTDMLGQLVYSSGPENSSTIKLDLSQQPKGLYLVKINSGGTITTQQIMVQ